MRNQTAMFVLHNVISYEYYTIFNKLLQDTRIHIYTYIKQRFCILQFYDVVVMAKHLVKLKHT